MRNINAAFSKMRREIRKGNIEDTIQRLNSFQGDLKLKIDRYLDIIKMHENKYLSGRLELKELRLEVVDVDSATSKITISPSEGRCTLKVAMKASSVVKEEMRMFAKKIMAHQPYYVSMRGKIDFTKGEYRITLYSGDKRTSVTYHQPSIPSTEKDD